MSKTIVAQLPKGVQCITAPNPSPMTLEGTNTYIFHGKDTIVLDPGPSIPSHEEALRSAIRAPVQAIVISHPHLDHSQNAGALAQFWNCPILALNPTDTPALGISFQNEPSTKRGVDPNFYFDRALVAGERLENQKHRLEVMASPGHYHSHLSLALYRDIFTADLIFAKTTTMIAPPEGDLLAFFQAMKELEARVPTCLWPAHGPAITNPLERIKNVIAHRKARHQIILDSAHFDFISLNELTQLAYPDIVPGLIPAAERTALAHIIALHKEGKIEIKQDKDYRIWIKKIIF